MSFSHCGNSPQRRHGPGYRGRRDPRIYAANRAQNVEWLLVPRRQSSGLKQEIDRFRQQRLNATVLCHRKMAQLRRSARVEVPAEGRRSSST